MKKVVAIYTGQGLAERIQPLFKEIMTEHQLINIIDDSLIASVIAEGKVTPDVSRRLVKYYDQARELGADVILNTCSSVGEVAELAGPLFDIPIVKIDEEMAKEAVRGYKKIGVIATLPTTLEPTIALLNQKANELSKDVNVVSGLAKGAYQALVSGDPEKHDELIEQAALEVSKDCDVIVLAQGSMVRMEVSLREKTGIPVFSSPKLGLVAIKRILTATNE